MEATFDFDPSGQERAVFARVWRRVMPDDRPDSPIAPYDTPTPHTGGVPHTYLPAVEALMLRELAAARVLRTCCLQLQSVAAAYPAPGDVAPDAEMQTLCRVIAAEKQRHGEALREILRQK